MRVQRQEYLEKPADEESTYVIRYVFKDEDREPLESINSMYWTLSAEDGEIINGRYRVEVASPGATVHIVLYGDDLQLIDKKSVYETRIVTVEMAYTSTYGSGLPYVMQTFFKVRNTLMVALALYISVQEVVFTDDYLVGVDVA